MKAGRYFVENLAAPVAEWIVGGTPLTSLMDVERRHGKKYLVFFLLK
ncbi:putative diphosphate--fructose-6-phosphate 1-phosphotransferase [Helianthus anomalus]